MTNNEKNENVMFCSPGLKYYFFLSLTTEKQTILQISTLSLRIRLHFFVGVRVQFHLLCHFNHLFHSFPVSSLLLVFVIYHSRKFLPWSTFLAFIVVKDFFGIAINHPVIRVQNFLEWLTVFSLVKCWFQFDTLNITFGSTWCSFA